MIINEDYFKDIDISDDDIQSSNEPCDGVPCSVGDINDDALRRYSHTIKIGFYRNSFSNINGDDDFPHTEMQNLAMHISYILDNYGIGHSPVYVLYQNGYDNPKWVGLRYDSENDAEENLKITDRGSYVQLETPYDREKPLYIKDIYIYQIVARKMRAFTARHMNCHTNYIFNIYCYITFLIIIQTEIEQFMSRTQINNKSQYVYFKYDITRAEKYENKANVSPDTGET